MFSLSILLNGLYQNMPLSGGFCQLQASLQNNAGDAAPKSMRASSREGSKSEALLPAYLNRQLLFVVDNARAGDFQPRF
jgi:hypothetical protein